MLGAPGYYVPTDCDECRERKLDYSLSLHWCFSGTATPLPYSEPRLGATNRYRRIWLWNCPGRLLSALKTKFNATMHHVGPYARCVLPAYAPRRAAALHQPLGIEPELVLKLLAAVPIGKVVGFDIAGSCSPIRSGQHHRQPGKGADFSAVNALAELRGLSASNEWPMTLNLTDRRRDRFHQNQRVIEMTLI